MSHPCSPAGSRSLKPPSDSEGRSPNSLLITELRLEGESGGQNPDRRDRCTHRQHRVSGGGGWRGGPNTTDASVGDRRAPPAGRPPRGRLPREPCWRSPGRGRAWWPDRAGPGEPPRGDRRARPPRRPGCEPRAVAPRRRVRSRAGVEVGPGSGSSVDRRLAHPPTKAQITRPMHTATATTTST